MKFSSLFFYTICLLVITQSCVSSEDKQRKSVSDTGSVVDTQLNENTFNLCELASSSKADITSFIQANADQVVDLVNKSTQNEECVFYVIDSLVSFSIQSGSKDYFQALDSLAKRSDGFLSDYMGEIGRRLFYKDFADMVNYFSSNPKSQLRKYVILGFDSVFTSIDADDRQGILIKIQEHFQNEIKANGLNPEDSTTVVKILDEINPQTFD